MWVSFLTKNSLFYNYVKLPFSNVKPAIEAKWDPLGKTNVSLDDDIYYFRFHKPIDKAKLLDEGSFHLAGKVLIIKPWSLQVEKERGKISTNL